ncbi:MAG: PAS domain S-box protein [Methylotetracoccus sp.]
MLIGESHFRWPAFLRYSLAAVLLVVGLGIRLLMQPMIDASTGTLAFVTIYPTTLITFYLCGTGSGLIAMVVSGLAAEYLFRPPMLEFSSVISGYLPLGFYYLNTALVGLGITVIRDQAARIRRSYSELSKTEQELSLSLDAMTRLHRMGQIPIVTGNLEPLFTGIVETAIAITKADFGNIQLVEPESGDLKIVSQIGLPTWWIEFWDTVSRGQGVCGTALERAERVVVEDVEQSEIFIGTPALEVQLRAGVRAVQSTPLLSRQGKPIGMFSTHYRTRRAPSERELRQLDFLAREAADVIERVNAEKALRQSRDDLNRAQAVGQIGSWRLDLRRNVLSWSDECYRIFGVPTGARMSYDMFLAIVHPDDRDYVHAQWQAALRGDTYDIEHRILVAGRERWVREKAFIESDGGSEAISGFGITQDITERKAIEFELLRLASVIEKSHDFIGVSDLAGRPLFLNRGGRSMIGLGDSFDVGRTEIRDYFVREERNFVDRVVLPAVLNEGRWYGDLTFRHWLTEAPIPVLYDVFRVDDPHTDKPLYFATVTRNMTEQRRAESALRASEARFRAVYEHAAIGIAIGDSNGNLLECNPAFQAMLGYGAEEFDELRSADLVHPDDRADNRAQIRRLQARDAPSFESESRYLRKDGSAVWVHKFISLLRDSDGKPSFLVALVTDITARRAAEETLREADRRKDEFLAALAHELRNPLAPIRTGLHVLRKTRAWSATTESLLEQMDRQIIHVVRLVDDLMDVSRITQGKIELRRENIDLVALVDQALAALRPAIDAEHHTLEVSLPGEPVWVEGDHVRIVQVLDNLIDNAVKYMESGGYLKVTLERRGAEAVIGVRDHGIGIAPDMLPHVFDLFTQSNHDSTKAHGGLGLGLSLVRRLIAMHGGQVDARSDGLGRGSEFLIRLPLVHAPSQSTAPARPLPVVARFPRRVLIVDDNRDVADSLAMSLSLLGIDVRVEYDGASAVKAFGSFEPGAVLLDLGMPGMDGYETAAHIRRQPNGRSVALIALTGWGQEREQQRSRAAGFDHHLVKPVDMDLLEETLASVVACRGGSDWSPAYPEEDAG